jgi:tetratricopeptide (TPR) repeat protein
MVLGAAGWTQKKPPATNAHGAVAARTLLVEKAHALDARGRPDMAMQLWQQVLLSDPNNTEALAGLARDQKLTGAAEQANATLERLRRANPKDANIGKIQSLASTRVQSDQLREAGQLARQGRPEEAIRIYRQLYGDHPPEGDIALAYYQTLYGTQTGKAAAVAGLRGLVARNSGDERYVVELGTMLTYDAKTRAEGVRILSAHPKAPNAQAALRQALLWDARNPNSAVGMRSYIKEHPQDREVVDLLKENEGKLKEMNAVGAQSPAERAAFAALNAHRLDDAQRRFAEILEREPKNARAFAGLGYLRMQQKNFTAAIDYFAQAEQNGDKSKEVAAALESARFWATMNEASSAFDAGQYDLASAKYKAALALNPRSPEALKGLAGLFVKQQRYEAAAEVYEQLVQAQPAGTEGWRGLFLASARGQQNQKAFAVQSRFPASVRTALHRDPEYLQTLAALDQSEGRTAEAQRVLAEALALPMPRGTAQADVKLQYAGLLMAAKRFAQAAELYAQVLAIEPANQGAWMGLVSAHHELNQDAQAMADVQRMPAAVYETSLGDANFLAMLAAMYQQVRQYDVAQDLLERAARLQTAAGAQPALALQLQLAAIYLQRNNTQKAYAIYRQVLTGHPERVDAWKGVLFALQAVNRNTEALEQIRQIPAATRRQLDDDIEFVQLEASLYAATGETQQALARMARIDAYYAKQAARPPVSIEIQRAWLLYNTGSDRTLYSALMKLGGRSDLTTAQRESVQDIWANWSVRRSATALANGNSRRAVEILDAAYQAFPNNLTVRKAMAGGYAQAGRTKEALAIFKTVPMQAASSGDFQGAVGAALAANDKVQAELWLRQALELYPHDAAILSLAARYEQARGDNERAAGYYRAALAAMPSVTPVDRLVHMLVTPEQDLRARRAATPADLQRLLDPNNEPFQKTTKLPPLPSYGPDPYGGSAPVVLGGQGASRTGSAVSAQENNPVVNPIPAAEPDGPASWQPQSARDDGEFEMRPAVHYSLVVPLRRVITMEPVEETPVVFAGAAFLQVAQKKKKKPTVVPRYEGRMHLPPDEQVIGTGAEPEEQSAPSVQVWTPQAPVSGLRITSAPMNPAAAQVLALFAEQTDSQLTQGSTESIRALPASLELAARRRPEAASQGKYASAQYTPSTQDAVAGAFSMPRAAEPVQQPRQSSAQPAPHTALPAEPEPKPVRTAKPRVPQGVHRRKPAAERSQPAERSEMAANSAPPVPSAASSSYDLPEEPQAQQGPGGLSDEQLQQRNLPPLRGPWVRVQRSPRTLTPREDAEMQLLSLESGNSGWLGGTGQLNYRSGSLGFDHLTALEAPFEVAIAGGYRARLSIIAKPVFLDSGQADGTAQLTVVESTTSGSAQTAIAEPIGTLTGTDTTIPAQQNATGLGGEIQLTFPHFAIAGGTTPYGFLVQTFTGRLLFHPGNGPVSFNFNRDSVKDSQLSYGGLRDPAGNALGVEGQVWGGIIANQGTLQIARGDAQSGYYFSVGGQYLDGYMVQHNSRMDGGGGAYWRAWTDPENGTLNLGVNFFAMHYANNQGAFTHGMGGYFSPQAYFLANVPFTWRGHSGTRFHYEIAGGLGLQAFQEDKTPLWPLVGDKALETSMSDASLPEKTSVGPNYDLHGQAAYQVSPHWFAGGTFSANNTRNYEAGSIGFFVRYLFREQPSTASGPTGQFPAEGFRPLRVP